MASEDARERAYVPAIYLLGLEANEVGARDGAWLAPRLNQLMRAHRTNKCKLKIHSSSKTNIHIDKHQFRYMGEL
jgi:hypothetical protein